MSRFARLIRGHHLFRLDDAEPLMQHGVELGVGRGTVDFRLAPSGNVKLAPCTSKYRCATTPGPTRSARLLWLNFSTIEDLL